MINNRHSPKDQSKKQKNSEKEKMKERNGINGKESQLKPNLCERGSQLTSIQYSCRKKYHLKKMICRNKN